MKEIVRWTTPSVIYKPSAIEVEDIRKAILTIKQCGKTIIERDITTADADTEAGTITWKLTQEETQQLAMCKECLIVIDWVTNDNTRGRSNIGSFNVVQPGKDAAI